MYIENRTLFTLNLNSQWGFPFTLALKSCDGKYFWAAEWRGNLLHAREAGFTAPSTVEKLERLVIGNNLVEIKASA